MIPDLDPQALAMREAQVRGEKASMAVKFCLALLGNSNAAGQTPEQMAEYTLTLAERLHSYVTGPQPGEPARIVS